MLDVYTTVAEDFLAMPVLRGRKSPAERFPGAVDTQCIEAMMQDRKALQAGTSHFLGQNFARASGIRFQNAQEKEEYAWTTSWGSSTRLIGGVVMMHGDDDGIILPPRVASAHVVLMPIARKDADREPVMAYTDALARQLRSQPYHHRRLVVEVDRREAGGARNWDWIKKGIPLRVEIGPKELAQQSVFVGRRDQPHRERKSYAQEQFVAEAPAILEQIQDTLFQRALDFQKAHTVSIADSSEFREFFTPQNPGRPEIHGGFAVSPWCGRATCELKVKDDLGVTIRCIPFDQNGGSGKCICCSEPADTEAIFAKAY
jgi:prolyl-tRNA synthetase